MVIMLKLHLLYGKHRPEKVPDFPVHLIWEAKERFTDLVNRMICEYPLSGVAGRQALWEEN